MTRYGYIVWRVCYDDLGQLVRVTVLIRRNGQCIAAKNAVRSGDPEIAEA